ncbi:GAF domain-containing protein [Andreprevotia lacus DSM 23236]|jgi:GAF domain-containing protein|uniref:GAF domain-containing protein n=1 Tax=Andreprevotia lacus DSM 23236 TaxID=1121001 RepID=A0A1W1XY11_9NEIS|nr:GAF domain-containing protein [Andreprevotia lacus]SMC28813.1 GAF domain-containing protein [Andreprevotia lacus DSM 23236]
MLSPELPANEIDRIATLQRLQLLDTPPDPVFNELIEYAASALEVPHALISIVDETRQWFKASSLPGMDQTGRDISFCAHAILNPTELMEVEDALLDARFWDNPLVIGEPHIRFYAGAPIVLSNGHAIGTVCVIDTKPHALTEEQAMILRALAQIAAGEIERQYPPEPLAH